MGEAQTVAREAVGSIGLFDAEPAEDGSAARFKKAAVVGARGRRNVIFVTSLPEPPSEVRLLEGNARTAPAWRGPAEYPRRPRRVALSDLSPPGLGPPRREVTPGTMEAAIKIAVDIAGADAGDSSGKATAAPRNPASTRPLSIPSAVCSSKAASPRGETVKSTSDFPLKRRAANKPDSVLGRRPCERRPIRSFI